MTTLTIENVDEQFINAFAELAQKAGANLRFEQKDHLPQLHLSQALAELEDMEKNPQNYPHYKTIAALRKALER